jgi:GH25 family lysozyme M1 (1,4-beta-N-acetylmuramidase)
MSVSIVDTSYCQLVKPEATNHVHVFISKTSQGERTTQDAQIKNTWSVVRAAENTIIAPYHYLWRSAATNSGKRQAEIFASILETLGGPVSDMNWNGSPLVWLDVDPRQASLGEPSITQNQMQNLIVKFVQNVWILLRAEVGIYTSKYAWADVCGLTGSTDIPYNRPLWVSNPGATKPVIPYDWYKRYGDNGYDLHQYSFTGKVPGIMKPNTPTVQAAVDLGRARIDSLDWFNNRFDTHLEPKTTVVPPVVPPDPDLQPDRVEIEIAGSDLLNIRTSPFGVIVAKTFDGAQFPVIGQAVDSQSRPWWQIGPEMYVASWYCRTV